jgi:hypothetical protein
VSSAKLKLVLESESEQHEAQVNLLESESEQHEAQVNLTEVAEDPNQSSEEFSTNFCPKSPGT